MDSTVYAFQTTNRRGETFYTFRKAGNVAPRNSYHVGEFYTTTCNETGVVTRHYQAARRPGGGGEAWPQPSFDWLITNGLLDSWQEKV